VPWCGHASMTPDCGAHSADKRCGCDIDGIINRR
jgi:hypothetical protein